MFFGERHDFSFHVQNIWALLFYPWSTPSQCRINNSSKCRNCYEPRVFGGLAVPVRNLVFIICKGKYYNLGARGRLSERGPYILHMIYKTLFAESKVLYIRKFSLKIFHIVWEFASAWKCISHCELFEVIWFWNVLCPHIIVVEGPFLAHLNINLLFLTNIWLASELTVAPEKGFPTWGTCIPRNTFKVRNRRKAYIHMLFILNIYLYIRIWRYMLICRNVEEVHLQTREMLGIPALEWCSRDRNLRDRDLVKTSRPRLRIHQKFQDQDSIPEIRDQDWRPQNLWILPKCFNKMSSSVMSWFFSNF